MSELAALAGAIRANEGLTLVVTGAGVSLASGIPTFRGTDPGAVWKRDVTELGTVRYFLEEPEGSWRWYLSRFEKVWGAQPNAGHRALVDLERWCGARGRDVLLVTQNIDGLHAQAGSRALVEVHGTASKVRCATDGCRHGAPRGWLPLGQVDFTAFRAAPTRANVPRCPDCGDFLRAHVLWFDELYDDHEDYQWRRVVAAATAARVVVFVGTSFSVGVTQLIVSSALERGVPVFNLDPAGRPMQGVQRITLPSEVALPDLMAGLG